METSSNKKVLISGASIAGLTAAWWLTKIGYTVTVVELASEPRTNGAAVDLRGNTIDIVKRMGLFEQLKTASLQVEKIAFKNADDSTASSMILNNEGDASSNEDIEIERDQFVRILMNALPDKVTFLFNNSITALHETAEDIQVSFKDGTQAAYHLVFGCDGMHSNVRRLWFGDEKEYAHFMEAYFSITTVPKLLIPENTMQLFNVPCKAVTLNAYKGKTDIIFCFLSDTEIPYDYRDTEQQRNMIEDQFAGQSWRTTELLKQVRQSDHFYFDKFCQIKMPAWTKGRVALIGDAAYCASPAAGMGGSLSMDGAAAVADALQQHNGNYEAAFEAYHNHLQPFIEEVQANAERNIRENFIPRTEEAICKRNDHTSIF